MKLNNVLLATKKTAFEHYAREKREVRNALSFNDLEKIEESHQNHHCAVNDIKRTLKSAGISYQIVHASCASFKDFQNKDLVVSIGGDGTLLYTVHYIENTTPVIPVKSDSRSHGALCTVKPHQFSAIVEKILAGEAKIEKWTRLEGRIGEVIDLALNEILVGPCYRPQQARYRIEFGGIDEQQSSSGVIISTGAGSTGWYTNIAGNDGKFPRTSSQIKYIVTEYNTSSGYRLTKGTLCPGETMRIRSIMNANGIVSFDGDTDSRLYRFPRGQTLELKISEHPLHVIVP